MVVMTVAVAAVADAKDSGKGPRSECDSHVVAVVAEESRGGVDATRWRWCWDQVPHLH
jgi:hypothetical protein